VNEKQNSQRQSSSAQQSQHEAISSTDEERERAPPSSQPRPVDDDEDLVETPAVTEVESNGVDMLSSTSGSGREGGYSYKTLLDQPSSNEDMVDDVDLELIEAEARRRLLAEQLGGKEEENSEDESDDDYEEQVAPIASPIKVATVPAPQAVSSTPKIKLSKKERINKTAGKKAQAEPEQKLQRSSEEIVQEVEAFARGHAAWKLAKTKKEFNKVFFPYFKEKLQLGQGDALQALAKLRDTWEKESEARQDKERAEREAKRARTSKPPKAASVRVQKPSQSIKATEAEEPKDKDVTMTETAQEDMVESEPILPTSTTPSISEPKPKRKRKRNAKDERATDARQPNESAVQASQAKVESVAEPVISKTAAKKEVKRLKQEARTKEAAEKKLNLVNSKDWYKDNEEQTDTMISIAGTPAEAVEVDVQDKKPPRKRVKRGPTESNHFSKPGASTVGIGKTKAARDDLIASLANDLLQDTPQLAGATVTTNGDDGQREPTFFSSGDVVSVDRGASESAKPRVAVKQQEKKPVLTKKQRRAEAAERNRERQIAMNLAAKDPNIERTAIETKKAEQSASFLEMAKKAREAVKAAAATVEKTVRENGRLQPETRDTSDAPKVPPVTNGEAKSKRKRKRNNNRLSEGDTIMADSTQDVETEAPEPVFETRLPLETALVNEQESTDVKPKKKRNRKPRAQKTVENAVEESKGDHP